MAISVLIVDDEKVFRQFIRHMELWEKGSFVLAGEAQSADEAMDFLAKREVDIVILDVSMPGKNGVELSGMIAGKYPQTAMIAISSFDDYDYVRQILKNGAHDYVLKSRLSEELLLRTLENAVEKLEQVSPWEAKRELRHQAELWLLQDGISPFTSDNSRKMVTFAKVSLVKSYSEAERITLMEGIGKIFEEASDDRMDVLAICVPPDRFVLMNRFYFESSEAKMKERTESSQLFGVDNIRRIFGVSVTRHICPPFFSDNAMLSFVRHKLNEEHGEQEKTPDMLAMTIGQQNKLLSAVEKMDEEAAERIVREIYEQILPQKDALCVMVTRELLELLERISVEYQIKLDFLPKEFRLYEYTREKSKMVLAANISGLYRNVLREMKEKNTNAAYSALVGETVNYLHGHYMEPLNLSMTAAAIGTNSSYLSRIFHEETGVTFTEYLNRFRVEKAEELIEKRIPLKDIVTRCGFGNYGYFLKIFKKYTGKTPKEFLQTSAKQ